MTQPARHHLIHTLRAAYSGELAAARAYAGHWRSLRDERERGEIRAIEAEELDHRRAVGRMLHGLGAEPSRWRELWVGWAGRALGCLCHVSGWLAPMVGAGVLEGRNVGEYESAARFATQAGEQHLVEELLGMAAAELEHERYFAHKARQTKLGRLLVRRVEGAPSRGSLGVRSIG